MTAQTLTLTEFLLARIAEDEAAAERGRSHPDHTTFANDNYGYLWVQPERVLAECEAKRRIAERAADEPDDLADQRDIGLWEGYVAAAEELATVCADHPDYNPDWRP